MFLLQGNKASPVPGIAMQNIDCLYRAPDGKLWIGGIGELGYFLNARYISVPLPPQLQGKEFPTQAMTYDADGALWISTVKHRLFKLKDQRWTELDQPDGFPRTAVSLLRDRQQRVWVGYMGGQVTLYDGTAVKSYSQGDGIDIGNVMTICDSTIGILLAGQHGINLFRSGSIYPNSISGRSQDRRSDRRGRRLRWQLVAEHHVRHRSVSPSDEISRFLKANDYSVSFTKYGLQDGLKGSAVQLRPLPSAIRAANGRLWFALQGDVVSVDPLHVFQNTLTAPVSIIRVLSDSRRLRGRRCSESCQDIQRCGDRLCCRKSIDTGTGVFQIQDG